MPVRDPQRVSPRRSRWQRLLQMAQSHWEFERHGAVISAQIMVEHALDAAGIRQTKEHASVRDRILKQAVPASPCPHYASSWEADVAYAISMRNRLAHEDFVFSTTDCVKAVSIYFAVWGELRKRFVTLTTFETLSKEILLDSHVDAVYLFGSLARLQQEAMPRSAPNDVDVLVLDDGHYSRQVLPLYQIGAAASGNRTLEFLKLAQIRRKDFVRAAACGLLDIVCFDGRRLGNDPHYVTEVARVQSDSLFLLKIAADLRRYSPDDGASAHADREPFPTLRDIRTVLQGMGLC